MSRLGPPSGDAERWLREALEQAAARTGDQVARRRVWTRVSQPTPAPEPSVRRWPRWALALVVVGGTAGALLLWPRPSTERQALNVPAVVRPAAPSVPEPAVDDRRDLAGPIDVRTERRAERYVLRNGAEIDLAPNSALRVDATDEPHVQQGRVSFSVPPQAPGRQFRVTAGPYQIVVVGTRFHVRNTGERVGVDVDEGTVEVHRHGAVVKRLTAGVWWTGDVVARAVEIAPTRTPVRRRGTRVASAVASTPAAPSQTTASQTTSLLLDPLPPLRLVSPSELPASPVGKTGPVAADAFREARAAVAEGRPEQAVRLLRELARGEGPAAENAAYEMGRVLRTQLLRPRDALRTWRGYRDRFPRGLLRAEVDLSILETLVAVGDTEGALDEAEAFLARHRDSERRDEVRALAERLRQHLRSAAER